MAPGGWFSFTDLREARAADSVCWKVTKEVRMAGTWVWGSIIPTATASMDESHSCAACSILKLEGYGKSLCSGEGEPSVPNP